MYQCFLFCFSVSFLLAFALRIPLPKFCDGIKVNFRFGEGESRFLRKSTLKWCGERPRGGRKGGTHRSRNWALGGAIQTRQYQVAPASTRLRERGMPPLWPPRGRSTLHFSVDFLKNSPPPTKSGKLAR